MRVRARGYGFETPRSALSPRQVKALDQGEEREHPAINRIHLKYRLVASRAGLARCTEGASIHSDGSRFQVLLIESNVQPSCCVGFTCGSESDGQKRVQPDFVNLARMPAFCKYGLAVRVPITPSALAPELGCHCSLSGSLVGPCWMTVVRPTSSLAQARTVFRWSASAVSWNGSGSLFQTTPTRRIRLTSLPC